MTQLSFTDDQMAPMVLCHAKAEREGFDSEGAGRFVLSWLVRYGPTSGEALVKAACEHGYRPRDGRAFGAVFKRLIKRHEVVVLRSDLPRVAGHGTSGGRLYQATA